MARKYIQIVIDDETYRMLQQFRKGIAKAMGKKRVSHNFALKLLLLAMNQGKILVMVEDDRQGHS